MSLRHTKSSFDRAWVGAGFLIFPAKDFSPFGTLQFTDFVFINNIPVLHRVHTEALGSLVDQLFQREDTLHIAWRPESSAWPGVGKHIVLSLAEIRALV